MKKGLKLDGDLILQRKITNNKITKAVFNPVPARDGLQPGRRLEPDHIQRCIRPLYAAGYDDRRPDFCADRAHLPGLELLGLPQTLDG
mgnify:CR=1 FL=1